MASTAHDVLNSIPHNLKVVTDAVSGATILATLVGWLPSIAAIMSIAWLAWQMADRLRYGPKQLRNKPEE